MAASPQAPLYRRIAAELRQKITNGELPPGSQLPTEPELGDRYNVSRNTIRLAISLLVNEGMISTTPGRGTFVRDRAMLSYYASRAEQATHPGSETDAYVSEVQQQGRTPSQTFEMRIVPATVEIAERLRIDEGDGAVVRRAIRQVDGQPWSVQDSYYPMDLATECGLLTPTDIPRGTIRVMAEHGYIQIGYIDELIARMPTPDEAQLLDLASGVPVIDYTRTAYTTDRPVRITKTTFAGDRNRLVFELGDLSAIYEESDNADLARNTG